MRFVLWIVGAAWAAIGAWYLYTTAGGQTGTQLGNTIMAGMLMYIFPGLVLMGLGSLLARRSRDRTTVVRETHAVHGVNQPSHGAAAAGTGAATAASMARHDGQLHAHDASRTAAARLEELRSLRDRDLIEEDEYRQRRAEILRGL